MNERLVSWKHPSTLPYFSPIDDQVINSESSGAICRVHTSLSHSKFVFGYPADTAPLT
jgi:hypothetical protein